jgi:hypothetical protein
LHGRHFVQHLVQHRRSSDGKAPYRGLSHLNFRRSLPEKHILSRGRLLKFKGGCPGRHLLSRAQPLNFKGGRPERHTSVARAGDRDYRMIRG